MTDPLFDVEGRVVILTGGVGKLGRGFAAALAERSAKVAILDLDAGSVDADMFGTKPENIVALSCDITDRENVESAVAEIERRWGAPYGLINAAAIDAPPDAPPEETGPFETYPRESWDQILKVNTTGSFVTCQVIGARMAEAGRGSIVMISSIYGLVSPDQRVYAYKKEQGESFTKPVAYSVSKSALLNLTRYLATYWAPQNVRVNTLTLGGVFDDQDPEFLEQYQARTPLGRMANKREYDGAVVFLMSDAASYLTGSNIVIDGGWTAW